jgi:hypothetical protein
LHQYVTHNRYYPNQKQFANVILAFMRETIPQAERVNDFETVGF